jgi:hypothetical protein
MYVSCELGDPGDRIFGTLGLLSSEAGLKPRHENTSLLLANCQISKQHMYVGIFAYTLTYLMRSDILFSAAGISANDGCPIWLPRWYANRHLFLSRGMDDLKLPVSNPYHEQYMDKGHGLFNRYA